MQVRSTGYRPLYYDNSALTTAESNTVSLVNNAMMYLFNQITYSLNDQEIETVNYPGQTTTALGLLKYDLSWSSTAGLQQCWLPDNDYRTADNGNTSMDIRRRFKSFSFSVPLNHIFGFMEDYAKIVFGVKHQLSLKREINTHAIQVTQGTNKSIFKTVLDKISLYMPIVKADLLREEQLLNLTNPDQIITLAYRPRYTQSTAVLANQNKLDWTFQNITGKPRYIIITFQDELNLHSLANFSSLNVSQLYVELNHKRYPFQDQHIDFANNKYSRVFKDAYDFKSKYLSDDTPCSLSFISYKSIHPIFVFDVSKYMDRSDMSAIDIRVRARFDAAVGQDVVVYGTLISDYVINMTGTGARFNIIK